MMPRSKVLILLSLATLFVPAFGQGAHPAGPGTLNYVEGNASIDGRPITTQSIGYSGLETGGMLATANGKAEILLTPGVFLRINDESTVKMISPNLTHTEVEIQRGRAEIEVDEIHSQNNLQVDLNNGQALLLKTGLYEFDADKGTMRVFKGQAAAFEGRGPANDGNAIVVKGGHELSLSGAVSKPVKFDKNTKDELYQWSGLRSEYLGEANEDVAESYSGGAYADGWLWDPDLYGYTWLPGDGAFLSPFGYGFYSPYYLYGGGFLIGRGYGYRGYGGFRGGYGGYHGGGYHGGYGGGGFHGGGGGGFHGGGGGGGHAGGGGGGHAGGGGGGHR